MPFVSLGHQALKFAVMDFVTTVPRTYGEDARNQGLILSSAGAREEGTPQSKEWEMATQRILVVDDDPSIRFLLRLIFEGSGYEVSEAQNGVSALLRIKGAVPDLVVTDIVMPVMDGGALIKRLKSDPQTAAVPIVAVTGNTEAKARAAAADFVLSKPFHQATLLEVVGSLLGSQKLGFGETRATA